MPKGKPESPCLGCEGRRIGCHNAGACGPYEAFRADMLRYYEFRREHWYDQEATSVLYAGAGKVLRRQHNRKGR